MSSDDPVNPAHYKTESVLEAIDVVEAFGLNFYRGNAVKYLLRAGRKGPAVTCLKKARWYLDREIAMLDSGPAAPPAAEGCVDTSMSAREALETFDKLFPAPPETPHD